MPNEKSKKYVEYVLRSARADKGFAARMKKADNEATEYQSWEILSNWIDLEYHRDRRAYGLVGASLARANMSSDGFLGLGKALNTVFYQENGSGDISKSSAAVRLRRLLACHNAEELIGILRSMLRFLESKDIKFSRAQILDDILWFDHDNSRERIRTRWAQDFFRAMEKEDS